MAWELRLPATDRAADERAVADLAFLADHAGEPLELVGDALIEADDLVEQGCDFVITIVAFRQPYAEIAVSKFAKRDDKLTPAQRRIPRFV